MRISDWSSDVCSSDLLTSEHDPAKAHLGVNGQNHFRQLNLTDALILSPALTSTLLKPKNGDGAADSRFPRLHAFLDRAKTGFNTRFDGAVARYVGSVTTAAERKWLFLTIYAVLLALLAFLFLRLPIGHEQRGETGCTVV